MSINPSVDPARILPLIEELCDLPYTEVQRRLNRYVQNATNAKLVFLISILVESEEMVIHVIGEEILDRELRFLIPNNVLYEAVINKTSLVLNVAKLDEELLRYINRITDATSQSLLTIPIQHPFKHYTVLLVCLVDYADGDEARHACTEIVQECFRFCLGYLLSSLRCYEETRVKQQCQNLLAVSRKLFTHLGDFPDLLREIMAEVRKLTNAERCSLFLLDPDQQDLVAKVFDGISTNETVNEMRIPIGQGIAGHVATTGKLLNIRDAYNHPLFYRGIDEATGFKTRNILCFPIQDEKGIVGVAQMCNKINGLYFDAFDEQIATAFSIYCGISIMHSIVYKKMQDAQARNKLSNEIMMYHMKVEESAVQALLNCGDDHNIKDFNKFHFSPRSVPYKHMPCYTIKMFTDLSFLKYWRIKMSTLARFILYVKKGYRDAPYHNWTHAFSVAHFAYLLIKNMQLIEENYMTPLQALVFFVSCLCHDIDHRGTNNSFQTLSGTVLASLYSSEGSVMERHHLAQTMCILNTEGCNIFGSLDSDDYSKALDLLRSNILATDLASHFRSVNKQEQMICNKYNKDDAKQQKLLLEMLMTCCDLSDQTKDWKVSKKTAEQIFDEFFSQGDLEKSMGNAPVEMMDRERASIPDLQIQFITNLVIPLFTNLSLLFPLAQPLVHTLEHNRSLWEIAKTVFQKYSACGTKGIDILLDPNFEDEVLKIFAQGGHCSMENSDECRGSKE
ncbi:cGMP-dependent 3',5'-cyclic phosphodiesterase-like isoform X1 [Nylanderia fulva]|uniref:cGMP-dependent 3',5'-cyclic phosphodiesterase-like isoform X1 n=1 Tax=Nylanderia fulva TaxID=613905 RepID=UPI0010FB19AE|nr:cGMP-dependent 3',5'-cyclic phosphodiesterase-like isoform X1 [Nylanderia fulva]XP_029164529.1 cGMP-dependent 3',5'-cyclic phosphodiesterase-like isoform X1 [Nylanderia fulva]XP_029164530.1 cGMP-dependent 3',5'-cyclic phosphodiesterase-like isoform X1 [Nylanderia fulva]